MKKINYIKNLFMLISMALMPYAIIAQSLTAEHPNKNKIRPSIKAKAGQVLWDNTNINSISNGIISTELGGLPASANKVNTADDFVIPAGGGWTIDSIYAEGFASTGTDSLPITSIKVIIYNDLNNEPGTEVSNQLITNTSPGNDSVFTLKLNQQVSLPGGKYWLSVMAVYDTATALSSGRWNWFTGSINKSTEWHLRDEPGFFGTNVNWQGASSLGIADVSCFFSIHGNLDSAGCPDIDPATVSVTNITSTAADVNFSGTPGGTYQLEYGTSGFTPGSGTKVNVSGGLVPLTGLTVNTTYDLYFRDSCSATQQSFYSGPISFSTLCNTFTAPFTETFEAASASASCWRNVYVAGDGDWTIGTGSTAGSSITTAHSGVNNALFIDEGNGDITRFVSPPIDITGLTAPELSFWYAQESFFGIFQNFTNVYYRTSGSASWTLLYSDSTEKVEYTQARISLPNPSTTYQIAFEGIDNFGFAQVVDDVMIDEELINDIAILNALGFEYTQSPLANTDSVIFAAQVVNNGANALNNVYIKYSLMRENTAIFTDSTNGVSMNPQDTAIIFAENSYGITSTGLYSIQYEVAFENADAIPSNNNMTSDSLLVTDTVYARDNGTATGSLGIGGSTTGILGQRFTLNTPDTLTSVSFFITNTANSMLNQDVHAEIFSFNGLPTNFLASTDTTTITSSGAQWITLGIDNENGYLVLPEGDFFVGVVERDSNLTLGTTPVKFFPGTTWINFPGSGGWANNEDFAFFVTYMLRAHFGKPNEIGLPDYKKAIDKFAIFPNPSGGEFNILIDHHTQLGNTSIEIYSISGQKVYSEDLQLDRTFQRTVSLKDLPKGTYIMKIESSEYRSEKKLIVQ